MEQEMNTTNKDKSDSSELKDSSAEEKIIVVAKVGDIMTDEDSVANDEIIDVEDDQIRNNVQNKALNFDNREQNDTSDLNDLNEQQNDNFTVKIDDDNTETLKQGKSNDINVSSNVSPADQDELSDQLETDFTNVTYENVPNDQKVISGEKNSDQEVVIVDQKSPNFDGSTLTGTKENDKSNNSTNREQSENAESRRNLSKVFDDNSTQFGENKNLNRSEEAGEDEMNVRKERKLLSSLKSEGDDNSNSKVDHALSSHDTISQKKFDMREEFDKFARKPPISRSDQDEKFVSTSRNQNMTDEEFDEFARTSSISKSGFNTRSQKKSDMKDEEFEEVARTPPTGRNTRSQKMTDEEFDEFARTPSISKSGFNTRSQKKSELRDEEFEEVARTPPTGRNTRSQKMTDEEFDEFSRTPSISKSGFNTRSQKKSESRDEEFEEVAKTPPTGRNTRSQKMTDEEFDEFSRTPSISKSGFNTRSQKKSESRDEEFEEVAKTPPTGRNTRSQKMTNEEFDEFSRTPSISKSGFNTRSQKKSEFKDEEFEEVAKTPPTGRNTRSQKMTDEEFDEFSRTPSISKSGFNTRSQKKSESRDEEFEEVAKTPPTGRNTRSQKMTNEEFDEFARTPSISKSGFNTRSQKKSEFKDEEFEEVAKTPPTGRNTRSQKMTDEEFDEFSRTPSISKSGFNTRSQKKSESRDEEFEEVAKTPPTGRNTRSQNMTDEEFDEFSRTPSISKSGFNTRSQKKSELRDEEFEEIVRIPPTGRNTRSQKMTNEEFDEFSRTPSISKSGFNTRSQKKSELRDEEFEEIARTPPTGHNTRSQKMTNEEFDEFSRTPSISKSGFNTRSQKKLDMRNEEFEEVAGAPSDHYTRNQKSSDMIDEEFETVARTSILKSGHDTKSQKKRDMTDGESDKFIYTPISKSGRDTGSQRKSDMADEESDKFIYIPTSNSERDTRSQRKSDTTDEESDKFVYTPTSKSEHDTRSQRKSNMSDEESDKFVYTPASNSERDTRSQRESNIKDEESDKFMYTPTSYDRDIRSQKKSDMTDEESDKFIYAPISKSGHETRSQRKSDMIDEESDKFIYKPTSKSRYDTRSQKKSDMTDKEFEKVVRTPSSGRHTGNQKRSDMTDEEFERVAVTPTSKSDRDTRSQRRSDMTDEEFNNFINTPISKPDRDTRSQRKSVITDEEIDNFITTPNSRSQRKPNMTDEEFDKFIRTPISKPGRNTRSQEGSDKTDNDDDDVDYNNNINKNDYYGEPSSEHNIYKQREFSGNNGQEFYDPYHNKSSHHSKKTNTQRLSTHNDFHSANTFDLLGDYSGSNGKSQKPDIDSQPSSGNVITNMFSKFVSSSNKDDEIKVTFHVHLPENIEKVGKPIVIGDVKELGFWEKPIIKLRQPFPQNQTYWQSDPVTISLSVFAERAEIQYKYAIHVPKSIFYGVDETIIFEGNGAHDNRTLDVARNNQFGVWKHSYKLNDRYRIVTIRDFAFVDYIFNSIKANNLKDKIMEYQHLLTFYDELTIRASNLNFISKRIDDKREKRLFLCLLLGYYFSRKQGSFRELGNNFQSGLLLNALEGYKRETFPSDTKDQIYTAITILVQHNAFQMRFDWLIIFTIAAEIDPNYTFIDSLRSLKYPDDNLFAKFIKGLEMIRPYIEGIEFESYVKIAKWLIQICNTMDSLFRIWKDVLLHNNKIDKSISKCFIERVRESISHDDAIALENHFKRLPKEYRFDVCEVFQSHVLFLLESPKRKWNMENIIAIKKLLQEDSLNWRREEVIQTLELISESNTSELLNIFPELLNDWFHSDFTDTKEKKIPKICITWFRNLLTKLDTNTTTSTSNRKSSSESNFVFSVFIQLERIYPLLGNRKNIWQNLTTIAIERVRPRSDQLFSATKFLTRIKEQEVIVLFLDTIKEILNKIVQQINDQLITKIFTICDCTQGRTLDIPNSMSEGILCHIINRLQSQSAISNPSENHLNILGASKFWNIILRATGNVEKLHSNTFVQRVKMSINELGGLLREKTIDIQLLQQLLKYPDDQLFKHFDAAVAKKKALGNVIISRDEIAKLRELCDNYQLQLNMLSKFYTGFCSDTQVTDVDDYIRDIKQHMQNSNKVKLKQVLLSDYWAFHEKTLASAERCYKFNQSRSFRNIFESCMEEDAAATKVEYIAQKLVPIVFEKYNTICKQFKDWEKLKCSDASLFWKNVTNVNTELDLMEGYKGKKNQRFVKTLDQLSKIPFWVERLEKLEIVVELFEIPHDEDDWLTKSIRILKDDSMKLSQLNHFFDYLDRNLSSVNQDCWKLIKELSNADDFISFLKEIAEHDIKNLINGVDDHSDERLIQEDTVSSLIQVKQFLLPLMNKNKMDIANFLIALSNVIKKNSTLGEKIALCSSSNMALRNMYKNISNRGEVTKEKIKNAVLDGTYTFARDEKEDKCTVSLKYVSKTSKTNVMTYNMNEILDLRGRALLIAKPKISESDVKEAEKSKIVMDEFVVQVDIAQEIINVVSMLMQMGHFNYRKFEKELQGTDKMKEYLKSIRDELEKWQNIVDLAQERCYYLTFFPARHILAFYDYFTSEKLDEKNKEECKTLIRFVNSKAQLPSRKDIQGISRESKEYFKILCEIGNELEKIFINIPKQSRKLKATGQRIISDLVRKGKLFVASCTDKTRVPNIIMSLYANHGYYPEPWQLLICTTSTTMEELTIFIKRSLFASNNGYENHLFCIANLELLDFELQYNLVNQIRSTQYQKDYFLALICCRETGMHHHILDQFSSDVHATNGLNTEAMRGIYKELCQNVMRVSSDLSGQGKTEWIKEDSFSKGKFTRNFLISDGMEFGRLVRQFKECKLRPVESLHINIISADYPEDVNMFLFELLTLGIVSTNVDIVCLPLSETPTHIYIEVASTTEQHLLNSLPMTGCLLFNHLTWNIKNLRVSLEIHSPIQVTCNYLNLLDSNEVDTKEIFFKTNKAIKEPLPAERCQYLIEKYFFSEDAKDISSFRFVEIFVNVLADQLVRLSSSQFFTVDNLRLMVKESKIRNLIIRTFIDVSKDFATRSIKTKAAQLESITADDENARLGTIVQWDDSNHLIVFFNSQTPDTISALYRDRTKVHDNVKILLKSQIIGDQKKWELDDYNSMSADALFVKLEYLARRSIGKLDLPEYALSGDNLIKMALILLRARANIPVIVCGEAGCGKTSLIAHLALMVEVQFQAFNLHAGIDEKTIMMFMDDALKKAEKGEIWLFFDEINTCNHIGLLADLISHRTLNGKLIHPNIRLFSACNPYRLRTKTQSEAGLTNKVKKYEEQSNLVYQVKPLPDQILDYVWDYGVLKPDDEYKYIQIMVEKELKKLAHPVFSELLYASQRFIRKAEEPYSVSLRDVKRAITLVKFFYNSLENRPAYRKGHKYPPHGNPTTITRSYVLALSLCYHSRLYEQDLRKQYRREMGQILQNHKAYIGEFMFAKIIREEQEDYINRMQCPPNTAHNEALLENVLVMIVCILTRIPLFLIGAPGSSKSLAIRLISSNLRGSDSNDKYFRNLPQIYLIPHQGSSSSTSDGIIKVFDKANKYQETTSKQFPVISVVLLDEVGLAETSPFNPLKVLHSLLEPSYPATGSTVSVIGISNWRLDNSKSSRALLVQRPQFDLDDLVDTAERLLNTEFIGPGQRGALEPLAKAYSDYEKEGQALPNFHGLRDYYALVKQLSSDEMTPENIQMALARNFGGTENNAKLCENYFGDVLKMFNDHKPWFYKPIPIEKLIDSNLEDSEARHLMVIGKSDSIVNLLTYQLRRRKLDPVVILGSQFPDDREDYSYSVLRRIMMCVEEGRPLILTDLEIIYGSLYDLWNQNYIVVGSKENVKYFTRVALGAYANPMLYVSPNFKCILVMDEKNLASADPPLLNRFEKQKMSINDTLNERQRLLVENLNDWAKRMSTLAGVNQITQLRNKFTQKDLFIGFDKDETLQSLVIDVTKNNFDASNEDILNECKECLIATASSDGIVRAERSDLERDEVERWKHVYFNQQHHDSLYDYFINQKKSLTDPNGHLVIVNTFSNINTDVKSCLQGFLDCQVDKLSTFKTEAQLSNRVKHFWLESTDNILILQCDVTTVNAGCIKLAKFIIEQFRNEFITKKDQMEQKHKHACIILHIHRDQESTLASFNFMCGWKQMTIETLSRNDIPTSSLLDGSLSYIINSTYPFEKILQQELLWCLLCMKYPSNNKSINHIKVLSEKILEYPSFIKCLKERTLEWIEEKSTNDWQYKVASNKQNLYPYSSFSTALQAHIRKLVRKPIAQIFCSLERLSATKTFFFIDDQIMSGENYEELLKFWQQIYMDKKIVKIDDLPDPKPDGYNMSAGSLFDLKFPFSFYFMKQIDSFKRYYEEEVAMLQKDDDIADDYVIDNHMKDFKNNILASIPQLKDSHLERFPELYFNDFITVIATDDSGNKNTKLLAKILKLLIGTDKVYQPIFLHTYWWKNANEVLAQLQLAQMSPVLIKNIEIQGDSIIKGSLEKYLVKEVAKIMLRRICGNFEGAANAHLIDKWQHDVTKVLSLGSKIAQARNLPDLQLLRIVNDLVATKTIPLDSIREIVQLGLSSDEQEVLSEEFVGTVLDKLDKLDHNEKNLIPRRSFIMRCLALVPIESNVRLSLYKKLFSNEPFPLMGAILERIFLKEESENEDTFFTIITDPEEIFRQSARLNVINDSLKDLDTNMATLCCDVIEQTFYINEELENLSAFFGPALEALYKQGSPALQIIASIALLKEFVRRFWDNFLQEDKNSPIAYRKMEEENFDSDELIDQINNNMNFAHPLINSLKFYFLRDLCQRDFSIDDIRRFCEAQKRILPWLGTLNWEDTRENRLSFNPYCNLPEYNEVENSFMTLYSIGNKGPFQAFMQNLKQTMTLTAKLSLMGLFFIRLHVLRASREWRHSEMQSADFLVKELSGLNLPDKFKTIATKILMNNQPLLQINNPGISNSDLLLKSVIAHIIVLYSSVEPNSSQLAMYLHKLQDCQNLFILTCISDVESVVLNAVAAAERTNTNKLTRYVCRCGYKYFVAGCGNVYVSSKCPKCGNKIGGDTYNKPADGNTRLDVQPIAQMAINDQAGYIGEPVNHDLYHSVRSLPPTSYRILHLIVHVLIGASAPQPAYAFLQKNNQTATDSEKYCMDHIRSDWEALKNLLNCSDENLALMFHSLISLMTEKPPLPNQQTRNPAERENWETEFHKNYITPHIKNITETVTNYRMKLSEALTKNKKNNIIEGEINQTLVMDKQYRRENLPALWRTIGTINFDSFRAYFMSDLTRSKNYPFLSVFFKYSGQLELLNHLLPIIKFVQILNSKLGYQLTRQKAREMTFRQFIEKESDEGENHEIFNSLKTAFDDFKHGWDTVIPSVGRYQCHQLPKDKPTMSYNLPVVFGLMEPKDAGIFLCAILDFLVNLQNNFLKEVIEIQPGTCKSLKFLDEPQFDIERTVLSTSKEKAKTDSPNGYCLQSMRLDHARSVNIINFDWDDEILAYSQRNLAVARGNDIIYDLTKIEAEFANILVFEKVLIETQPESQLYLEPFPYHMELFQGCMRILSDIKNLITQEPIPPEKMGLLGVSGISNTFNSFMYPYGSDSIIDNASEILSSLEILLCFVKRTAVGDGDKSIKEYISQWMKLSSLSAHEGFSKILNVDLRLKHLVGLYEFVEEQVANIKIKYINEKYKIPLSADMRASINKSVDFEQQTTKNEQLIPAEAFALALKRFMLRFLTLENQKEMEPLYVYLQDSSLNFWPSNVPENLIDNLFPEDLLVANTYDAYEFTINKIEQMARKQPIVPTINPTIHPQRTPTINKVTRSRKSKSNKFDAM
ncbi:hypothetical protein RclHR1_01690002 [Rhizophagus clarus]|uniref:RZ-type domain-containing protein n=1 Tax=Rhizophagus clarus TaxID=94130 RepID=A0A2Z6QIU2_9GLOM|nr:hypothetical protein RclHR1_01690002 [Rhizophagus clarus]GES83097.1 hypothetical protein GLOIN_2v1764819 [Rhizophagus clarus]